MNELQVCSMRLPDKPRSLMVLEDQLLGRRLIPEGPKTQMFQRFAALETDLDAKRSEVDSLLETSQRASGFTDGFGRMQPCPGYTSLFDVARRKPEEVRGILQDAVDRNARLFVANLNDRCASLVTDGRIGACEVAEDDPSVVRYFSTLGRTEYGTTRGAGVMHHSVTTFVDGHLVEMIDCESFPLDRAPRLPARVKAVVAKVPRWMRSVAQILVGQKIHEVTATKVVATKSWSEPIPAPPVFHYDPILTVGPYVLAAWEDNER